MGSTLPSDLILNEILPRTSPETVAASRAVCKLWNEATHEWSFAEKFRRRAKTVSGFFVQSLWQGETRITYFSTASADDSSDDPVPRELSLNFLPSKIDNIGAAAKHGLILCLCTASGRPRDADYVVCKPTTEQWTKIPKPKTRYFTRKMAMTVLASNPRKLRYKIVRFSDPKPACVWHKSMLYSALRCEVFDSATWAWRALPESIRLPFCELVLFHEPVVSAGGFFYALTSQRRVFAFDWAREAWEAAALPAPLSDAERCETGAMKLVECEGKLGLVCLTDSKKLMELWVSEYIDGVRAWNMRRRVSIEGCSSFASVLAMPCSDVVAFRASFAIELFRFGSCESSKNRVVKAVETRAFDRYIHDLFWIESDENFVAMKTVKKSISTKRSKSRSVKSSSSREYLASTTTSYDDDHHHDLDHHDHQLIGRRRSNLAWTPCPVLNFILFVVLMAMVSYVFDM